MAKHETINKLLQESPNHGEVKTSGVPTFITYNKDSVSAYLQDGKTLHMAMQLPNEGNDNVEEVAAALEIDAKINKHVLIDGNYCSSMALTGQKGIYVTRLATSSGVFNAKGNGNFDYEPPEKR